MPEFAEEIAGYYDHMPEHEWERMDRHRTEFAVTLKALEKYLPPPPAQILDCGGGPGRFAIELARRGYQVTLFDLSNANLRMARKKARQAGVDLVGFEHGTATDLSGFTDQAFDAVLLLGPLYHLLEENERRKALEESYRVLRPGGKLFAAFISRYAAHRNIARNQPEFLISDQDVAREVLVSGMIPPFKRDSTEWVSFMIHPREVRPFLFSESFDVHSILGVEGIVSMIEDRVNELQGEAWQVWADLNFQVAEDTSLHGCVGHLLAVAERPLWRESIQEVCGRLNEEGISYRIVGGMSARLQGVDLPVNDIDLEMDNGAVYRFQELFEEYTLQAVELRENETYRSHFGRFDVRGVTFEVMADLQRREGENWVPSYTITSQEVEVEGVKVNVSWLEEEVLAYMRRGRLERAAACLPLCDRERLGSLFGRIGDLNVV